MKESEFIELLNLYIDHEITSEDAARGLEAEVVAATRSTAGSTVNIAGCTRPAAFSAGQWREDAPDHVAALAAPRCSPGTRTVRATPAGI